MSAVGNMFFSGNVIRLGGKTQSAFRGVDGRLSVAALVRCCRVGGLSPPLHPHHRWVTVRGSSSCKFGTQVSKAPIRTVLVYTSRLSLQGQHSFFPTSLNLHSQLCYFPRLFLPGCFSQIWTFSRWFSVSAIISSALVYPRVTCEHISFTFT